MKEEQLQWRKCWDCEDYDQLKQHCDRLNIQKARNSYAACPLFRPRDLEECKTCHWYNKERNWCIYSTFFTNFDYSCCNYDYKYKENK